MLEVLFRYNLCLGLFNDVSFYDSSCSSNYCVNAMCFSLSFFFLIGGFLIFKPPLSVYPYPSYRLQSCGFPGPDGAESDTGEGHMYRPYIFMSDRNPANATGFAFPFHFQIWYISMGLAIFYDTASIKVSLFARVCTVRLLCLRERSLLLF